MAVKLTPKQQLVINQLLIDPSLKLCAEVTGLSYIYIRQLHTKTYMLDVLEERRKRVAEKAEVDAAWVLREQVKVYERCMQEEPVLDKDGNPAGMLRFDASGANRALENIGKHGAVQAFTPEMAIPTSPTDTEWTVRVVHTTKEEYDRREKSIEHTP